VSALAHKNTADGIRTCAGYVLRLHARAPLSLSLSLSVHARLRVRACACVSAYPSESRAEAFKVLADNRRAAAIGHDEDDDGDVEDDYDGAWVRRSVGIAHTGSESSLSLSL
jgi:hypothetical protein